MQQIVINELNQKDKEAVEAYLKNNCEAGAVEGIYYLLVPEENYAFAQAEKEHAGCRPFLFGIEVEDQSVTFELLVRSRRNLHCSCSAYATPEQREFLWQFVDAMILETGVRT